MSREFIIEDSTKLSWKDRQALVVAIATYNTGIDLLPVWEQHLVDIAYHDVW